MKAYRQLRTKLRRMHQFYVDESSRQGIMTFSTYGKLTPPRLRRIAEQRIELALLAPAGCGPRFQTHSTAPAEYDGRAALAYALGNI
jgi:hypothetical protein